MSVHSSKITVLVPAYECAANIQPHAISLSPLRQQGLKIFWIVTPSKDKTEKVVQEICSKYRDVFFEAPKGLYRSWNFGISKISTDFTYISTINDFPIQTNIFQLLENLNKNQSDICFSPPAPLCIDGTRNLFVRRWPVYKYKSFLRSFSGKLLPKTSVIAMQVNSNLSCLVGSWASVLARTSVLQRFPFPENSGHHADSIWFYNHLLDINLSFEKTPVAFFDPLSSSKKVEFSDSELTYQYRRCVVKLFGEARKRRLKLSRSFKLFRHFYSLLSILNKKRGAHPKRFWWINPYLWVLRLRKNWAAYRLEIWHEHWKLYTKN